MPSLLNIVAVVLFLFFVWGVLGIGLFKGTFASCDIDNSLLGDVYCDPLAAKAAEITKEKNCPSICAPTCQVATCEQRGGQWVNYDWTFDNIGEAMLTLFIIAVGEGWSGIFDNGMAASLPGMPPEEEYARGLQALHWLYFISFVVLGNFFSFNLFVGLLTDRLIMQKMELEGSHLLTENQRSWVLVQRVLHRSRIYPKPTAPTGKWRNIAYFVATHHWFDHFITIVILINSLSLALTRWDMDPTEENVFQVLNLVFIAIFTLEAVLKITAFGFGLYIEDNWNKLDLLVLTASYAGLLVGVQTSVVRITRVLRTLRMFKFAKGLQKLVTTLLYAMPSLFNVSYLTILIFFIFAVVGVELFGSVIHRPDADAVGFHDRASFDNWPQAMSLLYQIATTETWPDIMLAASVKESNSFCSEEMNNCGNQILARIYFPLFLLIGSCIVLNLLVTIVLENFAEADALDKNSGSLACFVGLRNLWEGYDPKGTRQMPAGTFVMMLPMLPPPLWYQHQSKADRISTLAELRVPVSKHGTIRYGDVVHGMAMRVFGINLPSGEVRRVTGYPTVSGNTFQLHHFVAARQIKDWFRQWKRKKRERELETQLSMMEGKINTKERDNANLQNQVLALKQQLRSTTVSSTPRDSFVNYKTGSSLALDGKDEELFASTVDMDEFGYPQHPTDALNPVRSVEPWISATLPSPSKTTTPDTSRLLEGSTVPIEDLHPNNGVLVSSSKGSSSKGNTTGTSNSKTSKQPLTNSDFPASFSTSSAITTTKTFPPAPRSAALITNPPQSTVVLQPMTNSRESEAVVLNDEPFKRNSSWAKNEMDTAAAASASPLNPLTANNNTGAKSNGIGAPSAGASRSRNQPLPTTTTSNYSNIGSRQIAMNNTPPVHTFRPNPIHEDVAINGGHAKPKSPEGRLNTLSM